jgi:hypothetical protein
VTRLPLRTRAAPWLIAATLTLTLVGLVSINTVSLVSHPRPQSAAERAAALRSDAEAACEQAKWRACLDRLDEADQLDPAGARETPVQTLRKKAEDALGGGRER